MDDVKAFIDAAQAFFSALASVAWVPLTLAVMLHVTRLALRVRAWQNILRASLPSSRVPYWTVFGAYVAGVGVNSILPARGGDVVKVYLARHRLRDSSYPTLASTLIVETIFDFVVASALFLYALTLGILPGVPDLPHGLAFDWSFVVAHPRLSAFLACVLIGAAIVLVGWASQRVAEFKQNLARGFLILGDRRAFLTQVVSWQAGSWLARAISVYFFLRAFHVDGGFQTVIAVLVVQGISTVLPFTPGGAGTQQAVLVYALRGTAAASAVLAFSVGMQLVTVVVNVVLGFGAVALMLRTLHIRRQLFAARDDLAAAESSPPRSRSAERV
ncbi:MAG TPA: lysylphosphatidylglycerol synthase transmembrane domain-containing protein [Gaiellaceae bacterium]